MIYAKPGESAQQFGGTCPDGWVQMQSERPEGNYVASETGEWVTPVKTMNEKLNDAIASYNADVEFLKSRLSGSSLVDGASQTARDAQIRADFNTRKSEYLSQIATIKAGG